MNELRRDFGTLALRSSPERSTSAPPLDPAQAVNAFASRIQSRNGEWHRNTGLASTNTPGSVGINSEIYSGSESPSPITSLKSPAPKRMVKLEMNHTHPFEHSRQALLRNSELSFDSAVARAHSTQPYFASNPHERSTSFRRLSPSISDSQSPLLKEMGMLKNSSSSILNNTLLSEPKFDIKQSGYTSKSAGISSLYQARPPYTAEGKRRNGSTWHSSYDYNKPSFPDDLTSLQGVAVSNSPLRTGGSPNNRFRSALDMFDRPPRHSEARGKSLSYSHQQTLMPHFIDQQAHDSVSSRSSTQRRKKDGGSNCAGRNGGRNRKGGSGRRSRRGGKNKGGERKVSNGRSGRQSSGHSMEISAIGIGSKMHVSWVEVFGTAKTAHVSLEDVAKRKMIVGLAMDQYGSRFIQQKLEKAPASHKEVAFEQIYPHTLRLCTDVFGNYVIQKLFEHGTHEHKRILASCLKGNVLALSLQMYGCRVIQKAIDVLNLDEKADLVHELRDHVMKCVRDQNGNHVIQKCIEKVPPSNIQFIIDSFKDQCMKLAMHPYGCRVIQRLLEHCSSEQRDTILSEIHEFSQMLSRNQYGNYVVQHILIHANAEHRAHVMRSFRGSLVKLSKHKFASNVIEKCVTHATRNERDSLINEMLGEDELDSASLPFMAMARDQYANYVVQRLIEVVDPEQRQYLIQRIQRHLPYLSKLPYGKHIIATIEKAQGSNF
eukprot:CAMPEP_0184486624 /NCGR_PEP_ID=MMETSP0113_2-20130426/8097_1 /TAXON_ID=91329 /ORGANISM="Norrisiella sphaerica, Strain BC52" /LENGTH=714 /DNA_ID=CAMNT_0026868587 /DNA_START=243 /DNA_END=2387 /DNA_ORIENTATION=-